VTFLRSSIFSEALPAPIATDDNGSSITVIETPLSSLRVLSRFFSKAPPPVNIIPLSIISAENSGGIYSKTALTVSIIASICSEMATRISSESMDRIFGIPEARSLPLASIFFEILKNI
jgi:hypothetical protein